MIISQNIVNHTDFISNSALHGPFFIWSLSVLWWLNKYLTELVYMVRS